MKRSSLLTLVAAACLSAGVFAQDRVTLNPHVDYIDVPGAATGEGDGTIPVAMNKAGAITGSYRDANGAYHGFLRTARGKYLTFDAPNAGAANNEGTWPRGINARGEITGYFSDAQFAVRGFLRAPDGTITVFDAPGVGSARGMATLPEAMNDDGQVAGNFHPTGGGNRDLLFLRYPDGKFVTWRTPSGNTEQKSDTADVGGMNGKGYVVGNYFYTTIRNITPIPNITPKVLCPTCISHHGVFLRNPNGTLSTFEPFGSTNATGINAHLTIVGYEYENEGPRGFLLFANGTHTTFSVPGASFGTYPASINEEDEVAGSYLDQAGVYHAFFRSRHGAVEKLTIPESSTQPPSNPGALIGTAAVAVNDAGRVLGYYTDANFVYHGFLWRP